MPSNCYTKALREPIYFLWECKDSSNKLKNAQYRSREARNLKPGSRELVRDHAIPFVYLQNELLALENPTVESVKGLLDKYLVACLITTDQDKQLNAIGLGRKMTDKWKEVGCLARYKAIGIETEENK